MVFQNPDNQLVATTVEEDVAFGLENIGLESELIRQRVDEALACVGMTQFRDKAPHLLSGGQKQRLAIAGVIAMRPKYIIFDEPTAMLDPSGRQEVIRTMQQLNVLEGNPKEVFSQVDYLKQMHLDVPPIAELAGLLHSERPDITTDILTIEEMVAKLCP